MGCDNPWMHTSLDDPLAFLERVWGEAPQGHVFTDYKDGSWVKHEFDGSIPNNGRDVYFTPNQFKAPARKDVNCLPGKWLYADLDEVDPFSLSESLTPTLSWETSPGRYQAMWELEKALSPAALRKLNRLLTYKIGADPGGWALSKVLRIPGTINCKREEPFEVEMLGQRHGHPTLFVSKYILEQVRDAQLPSTEADVEGRPLIRPKISNSELMRRYKVSGRLRELLSSKHAVVGERSERLWELEKGLLQLSMTAEEAFVLIEPCVWNKWGDRPKNLWKECLKAEAAVAKERVDKALGVDPGTDDDLPDLTPFEEFVSQHHEMPAWLVEMMWTKGAHGLIVGEAKTYKSLIACELAVAVATGAKFFGEFEVPVTGPVIYIQEENTKGMVKSRLKKIQHARDLVGHAHIDESDVLHIEAKAAVPIYLWNNEKFNLTSDAHMQKLERQIEKVKPALVILDPVYLMMPGVDENSSSGVTPIVSKLLDLKKTYGCGIIIVHHYRKADPQNPVASGTRISGSSVFHRWFESALYVEKGTEQGELKITPDHRQMPPQGTIKITLDMGEPEDLEYETTVQITSTSESPAKQAAALLLKEGGVMKLSELAAGIEYSSERCRRLCEKSGWLLAPGKKDGTPGRPSMLVYMDAKDAK